MTKETFERLFAGAMEGYRNAYAPYSRFRVGAAVLLKNGKILTGGNIENAAYGLCNCAERTVLFRAYAAGYRKEDIVSIMVTADTAGPVSPCGACRQVMSELLDPETTVILTNLAGEAKTINVAFLLPYPFGGDDLDG